MASQLGATPLRVPSAMASPALDLPSGWSVSNDNEILNDLGEVMMDINETIDATKSTAVVSPHVPGPQQGTETIHADCTMPLRPELAAIFDNIEKEEAVTSLDNDDNDNDLDQPSKKKVVSRITERKEASQFGKGLSGLRGAFGKPARPIVKPGVILPSPIVNSQPPKEVVAPHDQKPKSEFVRPPRKKTKTVTFAEQPPDDNEQSATISENPIKPEFKNRNAFTVSDVVERFSFGEEAQSPPVTTPVRTSVFKQRSAGVTDVAERSAPRNQGSVFKNRNAVTSANVIERIPLNADASSSNTQPPDPVSRLKSAPLDPRLAALLPRSYAQRLDQMNQPTSSDTIEDDTPADDDESLSESTASDDDPDLHCNALLGLDNVMDSDDDDSNCGSSLHSSYSAEDGNVNDDDPLSATLDAREIALRYHGLRPLLGSGPSAGSLGGDVSLPDERQDLAEWVPSDTTSQHDGIPRQSGGISQFRSMQRGLKVQEFNRRGETMVNGKLFRSTSLHLGSAPTNGGASCHLPNENESRRQVVSDDLTEEEQQILKVRLEALELGDEEREVAEKLGSQLMELMEKAQRGEL